MSCPACEEMRRQVLEQNHLRQEYITQQQNKPVPPQTPKDPLPQTGTYHRG